VILNEAGDRAACEALRAFLMSEPGRAILRRYGFMLPGE
jgi:ABC-type molybdate transport system substrate-binding protein